MAQKIVGLDIGNYSLKAVVVESTYRGWELVGYHETKLATEYVEAERMIGRDEPAPDDDVPRESSEEAEETYTEEEDGDKPDDETVPRSSEQAFDPQKERIRIAIAQFIRRYGGDWDSIYTAFHGDVISMKALSVPFIDQKKIEETLPFTLEDLVPFSLRDKIVDYQMLTREPGNTQLLVGILDRSYMAEYLANFENIGKEPKGVVVDALAVGNLFEQLGEEPFTGSVTAILDFGHRTTTVTIMDKGQVAYARTIPRGGQDLTQALAEEFDIDFEDAERSKHTDGFLPSAELVPQSANQQTIADALTTAIDPLVQQIGLTFQSYVAARKHRVERILIVGGGARLNNLTGFLSERLGLPVSPFNYLNSSFNRLPDTQELEPVMAMGLGLAFTGLSGSRLKRLNFRKGPFAFKGNYDYWKGRIAHLAVSAALVFMFYIISIWSQFYVLESRSESFQNAIASTCKEILGQEVREARICMSHMMEVIGNQNTGGTKLKPEVSVITLFDELASRMTGEGMSVEVEEIEIKTDRLRVKGEVDSIATVGTIVNNLRQYPCFTDINQGPTRANVRGDRIEFSLSIIVDCSRLSQAAAVAEVPSSEEEPPAPAPSDSPAEEDAEGEE